MCTILGKLQATMDQKNPVRDLQAVTVKIMNFSPENNAFKSWLNWQ